MQAIEVFHTNLIQPYLYGLCFLHWGTIMLQQKRVIPAFPLLEQRGAGQSRKTTPWHYYYSTTLYKFNKTDRQGAQTHPSDHQIAKCDLSLYRTLLQSPVLAPLYLSAGIVLGDVKLICSVMEIHALELPAHSFVLMFMSEEVWNSRLF